MTRRVRGVGAAAVLGLCACASGPRAEVRAEVAERDVAGALVAYERVRGSDGADAALLRDVAALVLEEAVAGTDLAVRDAALSQLRRGRERSRAVLARLAAHEDEAVRAAALELQASAGDELARAQLRASLDSTDQVARAAAQGALDPRVPADLSALHDALVDPSARVRRAAALRLRLAEPFDDVRVALELAARVDPSTTVRVAALQALARQGAEAFHALRDRLADPEPGVRMATLLALHVCDPAQARGVLSGFLATPPSPDSLEAARLLAARGVEGGEGGVEAARAADYLLAALSHEDEPLRSQAAVAVSSLPTLFTPHPVDGMPRFQAALLARLQQETTRHTRLLLAQTLLRSSDTATQAEVALRELLAGDDVPAVMAATALARLGDAAALARLDVALTDSRATHRRIAASALTWDAGDPDRARAALGDEDALVRVAVAGGILSAH